MDPTANAIPDLEDGDAEASGCEYLGGPESAAAPTIQTVLVSFGAAPGASWDSRFPIPPVCSVGVVRARVSRGPVTWTRDEDGIETWRKETAPCVEK